MKIMSTELNTIHDIGARFYYTYDWAPNLIIDKYHISDN